LNGLLLKTVGLLLAVMENPLLLLSVNGAQWLAFSSRLVPVTAVNGAAEGVKAAVYTAVPFTSLTLVM
jgi:hypothetical protein